MDAKDSSTDGMLRFGGIVRSNESTIDIRPIIDGQSPKKLDKKVI